jgi:hypothetical protein
LLEEALIDASGQAIDPELWRRTENLRDELEADNRAIYQQLRHAIRQGHGARSLLEWIPDPLFADTPGQHEDGERYDYLDALLSGVAAWHEPDGEIIPLGQEMVFYQPTPARHIFDLLRRLSLGEHDVLMDLGSGLGHVPLLAAICSRAQCIGIEREAAYVACAQRCAGELQLTNAHFIQQDARAADFSRATVFYLYTPFTGGLLRSVLDRFAQEAAIRPIRVCTLGPCTEVVAGEAWLMPMDAHHAADRIALFRSA